MHLMRVLGYIRNHKVSEKMDKNGFWNNGKKKVYSHYY